MHRRRRLKLFKVTMVEEIPVHVYLEDDEDFEFEDQEEYVADIVLIAKGPAHARIQAMRHNKGEVVHVERYYDLTDRRFFERALGRSIDVIEEVLDDS